MKSDLRIDALETPRMILRPYRMDDAERLTELLQDPEIHRWTNSIPFPYTLADAREFLDIREKEDATGASFVWAMTDRASGTMIGAIGLHDVNPTSGRAELGYWLGAAYRGSGYTTEAARRVISWCFEFAGFHRIQATYLPGKSRFRWRHAEHWDARRGTVARFWIQER